MKKKTRCLLIWPPLLTSPTIPLGIPSLLAYLTKNGYRDIEVFDMNISYLKKMRLFFFLSLLNKKYHNTARALIKKPSAAGGKPKKTLFRKTAGFIPKYMNKALITFLERVKEKEKAAVPWSLGSILSFDFGNKHTPQAKRARECLAPLLDSGDIGLVGISAIYPEQLFFALMISGIVKQATGGAIPVALGGAQITKHIDSIRENANSAKDVDFFVVDDGEEPLLKLLEAIPDGGFHSVPNLYFRGKPEEGHIRARESYRVSPRDLTVPDFSGFELSVYKNQLPVMASRGCFWSKCNFCTYANLHEKRFTITPAEKTLAHLKEMAALYGITDFKFVDDALPPAFMKELAGRISGEKLSINWACSIVLRPEFASRDFCRTLSGSGLRQVSIGLESASPRILRLMNKCHKDMDENGIADVLASLKDAGINVGLHIMFGFPSETADEARVTLDFLLKNKGLYDMCMYQPFCLEDNTPVFRDPGAFGITRIYNDDKDSGERLGYRYEVGSGMSQKDSREFAYNEARKALKASGIAAISSRKK
jgi:radical SAM superfamily enzyme YgiQ (UPF0313 family)